MSLAPILEWLEHGEGVWLRGPPGSGRTHQLRQLAEEWPGPVVWLRGGALAEDAALLAHLPPTALVCVEGIPAGTPRSALAGCPALVTGPLPGDGWRTATTAPLEDDAGVRLFLEHAPGAGPLPVVRQLVQRLGGHPTAIIAASRRWPMERVDQILLSDSAGWPGLESAWQQLAETEKEALAFLAALSGPARAEGVRWCGRVRGVEALTARGWVSVQQPGIYTLPPAISAVVRGWRPADPAPYYAWFLQRTRAQAMDWDRSGGARQWFRCGMWPALLAWKQPDGVPSWFFVAWSLSGEQPAALRAALADAPTLPPVVRARCEARAWQSSGEREEAIACLQAAQAVGGDEVQRALLQMELGVAHHRLRQVQEALVAYAGALKALDALGQTRGVMLCQGNLAALSHDAGEHDAAHAGYLEAIAEASRLGQVRLRGMFSGNLGALLIEMNRISEARSRLHQAAQDLRTQRDDRFLAIVTVNRGAVALLEQHLDVAAEHYQEAIRLLRQTDPASTALCYARLGAVAALRGAFAQARQHHDRAEDMISPQEDPFTVQVVLLWRVFLEWQTGDRASALARRRETLTGEPSLQATSDDARLVLRMLERLAAEPGSSVLIGPDGRWFRVPGGTRVSVEKYAAVTRILTRLAETAEQTPGEPCSAEVLVGAGWPGEHILPDAARNRLSVSLNRLRRLGLRGILQRTSSGWRLDPAWPVLLLREEEPISEEA